MVRIGTWNLENLFRPGDEDGPRDPAAYDAKLAALAEVIARIQPDVLAVQEVGNPAALADLAERAGGEWHCTTAGVEPDQRPSGSATCPGCRWPTLWRSPPSRSS